jgi:uncharacterized protein (TIGR03382 family)
MKRNKWMPVIVSAALVVLCIASIAHAQAELPPLETYTQNFDSLANTGTSSTMPVGWAFSESGTGANTIYTAGTGSSNAGDTYSFGSATAPTDRALGGLLSGSVVPTIGASFTNNTGSTIGRLSITYACEQWRLGFLGRTDRIDFQYSTDATSLTTGTWLDHDALDCVAPVQSGTVGALDGNAALNRITPSATIVSLNITNGTTFWIRWTDLNATNSDDGLGIDDFSMDEFTPTAITLTDLTASTTASPAPIAFGIIGLTAAALLLRRRQVRSTSN